jgi:hypothetical protein
MILVTSELASRHDFLQLGKVDISPRRDLRRAKIDAYPSTVITLANLLSLRLMHQARTTKNPQVLHVLTVPDIARQELEGRA